MINLMDSAIQSKLITPNIGKWCNGISTVCGSSLQSCLMLCLLTRLLPCDGAKPFRRCGIDSVMVSGTEVRDYRVLLEANVPNSQSQFLQNLALVGIILFVAIALFTEGPQAVTK